MLLNNNKRKLYIDDFNKCKKAKTDDSDSDDYLQIDLDFGVIDNGEKKERRETHSRLDNISVTLSSGRRCYVKISNDSDDQFSVPKVKSSQTASAHYYTLLDEVEKSLVFKKSHSNKENDVVVHSDEKLWVDKYSPQKYGDLLSYETVNRNLLTWLKLWDKFVFKRDSILTTNVTEMTTNEDFRVSEVDNRPIRKAVLLSGPPGIGKTTLAVILARHCGYNVKEMNASDERNAEQLYNNIDIANSTNSMSNKENVTKPFCLIIDEIDGTSSAAVNVLVNAINSSCKSSDSQKKKHSEKGKLCVRRPIICICNDLYAPSLKNLRPLCYLIKVGTPDYSQMLSRISDICNLEQLRCDRSVVNHMIDSSNRDIRSCLNTLQFLKQNGKKVISLKDLESLNVGNKDVQKGIFSVWEEIFTSTTLKKSYAMSEGRSANDSSQRCKNILQLTQSTGDLDRVISGIHENYLSLVRFKDVHLREMTESTRWLMFNDLTNQKIATKQCYELTKYKQYIVPFFHLSFASSAIVNHRIEWPTSDANAHFHQQKLSSTYQSFMAGQCQVNSWYHDKRDIIKTVLPSLSQIIRPCQLRAINTQLYSSKEKTIFQRTVANMASTGLSYVQEKTGDLHFEYVLQPNIDALVGFDLLAPHGNRLAYSMKQLISNEIHTEKIRKHAPPTPAPSVHVNANRMAEIMQKEKAMTTAASVSDRKNKAAQFTFQIEKRVNDANLNPESYAITTLLNKTVLFRFKEGCTNAIRRAVKVKDL